MELKFIWVEEYKNLKKIGFNFNNSSNQFYDFKNGKLEIYENKNKTPNGFFSDNILGVTGIVGKNGSGKTNLSEFISYNLAHVSNNSLSYYGIDSKGIIVLGKYIFYHESISILNSEELRDMGYDIYSYEKAPLDSYKGELRWDMMGKNKYFYYCSSFDFRPIIIENNLANISTSYLAQFDKYHFFKHRYDIGRNKSIRTDSLLAHYRNEKIRESDFIIEYNNKVKAILGQKPTNLFLSIDHISENISLENPKRYLDEDKEDKRIYDLYYELDEIEREILGLYDIQEYISKDDKHLGYDIYEIPIEIKKSKFKQLFLTNFFRIYLKEYSDFEKGWFKEFIFGDFKEKLPEALEKISSLIILVDKIIELSKWKEEKEKTRDGKYFDDFEKREIEIHNLFTQLNIVIDSEEKLNALKELIANSNQLTFYRLWYHYQFESFLSSGQQNKLNFFSRFLWAKKEMIIRENLQDGIKGERIIIFIDEGEITLHPEWQREYFKTAISFISDLFKDRELQMIFITHSPYVLSDFPKNNVIFLNKNDKGEAIKVDLNEEFTFGANIHDLLSSSFFMESTIGEFASDKIKEIVNFYYKVMESQTDKSRALLKEEYSSKRNNFHFIIDNVGDDVIKGILENHIEFIENNLIGESYINSRILKLEGELKRLRREND